MCHDIFQNDTRGSALRGVRPLINTQEYWDDHPEICAVVTREYHCGTYHRKLKESFQLIDTGIDRHVFNRLRPWFFRLPANGPPAVSAGETTMISQNLSMSLVTLIGRNQLGEWDQERNLKAPYDYFYHFATPCETILSTNSRLLSGRSLTCCLIIST